MKDIITLQLDIQADFQTIQALRRALAPEQNANHLARLLGDLVTSTLASYEVGDFELTPVLKVSPPREPKKGKRPPLPVVKDNRLVTYDLDQDAIILDLDLNNSADWPYWLEFLGHNRSFRYETQAGHFTALKEKRGSGYKWYAHRRLQGQLKRRYLGVNDNLTAQKLRETAVDLAQLD